MTGKHQVQRYGEGYMIVQPDGTPVTTGTGLTAVFSKRKAQTFAAELDRQRRCERTELEQEGGQHGQL